MPVVNTYWGPDVDPYKPPEYDEDQLAADLSNSLLAEGGFDLSGLEGVDIDVGGGILGEAANDPNSLIHHSNFRAGSGMDNAVDVGYMNHTYIGDDGFRYKMIVSWDEAKQAMKYEQLDERVYRWSPSDEHKRTHRDQSAMESAYGQEFKGGTGSGWYTEAEIKQAWDAGDMRQMQDQGVSWDQYWGYVTGVDQLIHDGVIQDYSDMDPQEIKALQDSGEYVSWGDVPEYMDLVSGLGIPTQFESRGDVYNFNGFGYSRDYHSDKSDGEAIINGIGALAIGAATGGALSPVIGGLTGAAPAGFVGPLSAGQIAGGKLATGIAAGIGSAAAQGVTTGSIDPRSVLASAVVGGLNPGGMLAKELEGTIGNSFNPDSFGYGFVSGGGNNVVNQLISNGELDVGAALQAGLISGGINSVRDTFYDSDYYSREEIAKRYLAQGYTADDAWRLAGQDAMLNTTDLGALVGEGGLLSFIPRVPIGFIKDAEGFLFGTDAYYATLPDGTKIPYSVLEGQGQYVFEGEDGNEYIGNGYDRMMELGATFNDNPGSWEGAGLLNNPITQSVVGPLTGLLPTGDRTLTEQQQTVYDQYLAEAESLYGPDFTLNGNPISEVQRQILINDYVQSNYNQYWSFWHGADGLDENYTVAPNPRGDSELLGATFAGYDENGNIKWTTGTRNWTTDAAGNIINTTLSVINSNETNAGGSTTGGYTPNPDLIFYVGGEGSGVTLPANSTYQDYQNFLLTNYILGNEGDNQTVAGTDAGASTDSVDNTGGATTDTGGNVTTGTEVDNPNNSGGNAGGNDTNAGGNDTNAGGNAGDDLTTNAGGDLTTNTGDNVTNGDIDDVRNSGFGGGAGGDVITADANVNLTGNETDDLLNRWRFRDFEGGGNGEELPPPDDLPPSELPPPDDLPPSELPPPDDLPPSELPPPDDLPPGSGGGGGGGDGLFNPPSGDGLP
ncbi:MAG: hypothetical protein VW715_15515, partial [Rhodospirillales bacterium]